MRDHFIRTLCSTKSSEYLAMQIDPINESHEDVV